MLYSDNAYYTIRYSEPLGLVEIIWHNFVSSQQLQSAFQHVLEVLQESHARYFLSDGRYLGSFRESDQDWMRIYFLPELNKAGISKFARITNPNKLTHSITSSVISFDIESRHYAFKMKCFTEREGALEWLLDEVKA
ncbi:MAG: hypothetical protein LPK09_11470 [Hymenobacteraceae bacterium]|nr:hypothetical protein [Hymenobacteraceae bacterium]